MDLSPEKPGKELAGGQLTPSGGTRKVQDFKQESGIFSSSVPEGFTLTIGWYGVKDVMRMGSYCTRRKVLRGRITMEFYASTL